MTFAHMLVFALQASIFLLVLSIGLRTSLRDFDYVFRYPGFFARAILSMNVVMLAFAISVGLAFDIHPAVKIALIALAVSPVPPLLAQKKDGADCMLSLIAVAAAAAVVIVPLTMELLQWIFGAALHMPIGRVVFVVFITLFAPLGVGMLVRRFWSGVAARSARPVSRVGTVLLIVAVLPVLYVSAGAVAKLIGDGVIIFPILFAIVGLVSGHLLGGPDPGNRATLAIATSRRHPGMAIAIASINFPDQKEVPAVVVCCLIFGLILAAVYTRWRPDAVTPVPKYS